MPGLRPINAKREAIDAKLWSENKVFNQSYRWKQTLRPKFGLKPNLIWAIRSETKPS